MLRTIGNPWMLAAVGVVAVAMAPVLVGFAPLNGDPEQMYQPIKVELSRALAEGRLPFWSGRFGLGVPLVAESHVAAFYPLNWLIYRIWDVGTAYRLSLWLHSVAMAAATFAYARNLRIGPAGSSLAALAFALCGFQAAHVVHEPFYHAMPYLPLCLLLADRYAATGRPAWLAGLAMAWAAQVTLGHFQIQMWTAGLVLLAGAWRLLGAPAVVVPGSVDRRPGRILGLILGLAWGVAIVWVQLRLTGELVGVSGFDRPPAFLALYSLPPPQWAQLAMPAVFLGRPAAPVEFWARQATTAGEACAYVGVVPLILAFLGLAAVPRDRALRPWLLVAPLAMALATMPGWWPDGYYYVLHVPGMGLFRAPARYTLLTSMGLVLLAGRGLDLGRSMAPRRFWIAMTLAVALGGLAWASSLGLARDADYRAALGAGTIAARFAGTGLTWALGLSAIVAWRRGWIGAWLPVGLAAIELVVLFFAGPIGWSWEVRLPESSPVLRRLAELEDVGLVAGSLKNIPVRAGLTTAFPEMGITAPPPNYLLEASTRPPGENSDIQRHWLRRFGVTHGVWSPDEDVRGTKVLAVIADPVLDRMIGGLSRLRAHGLWKLVHDPRAFPPAWVARRVREATGWGQLYSELSVEDAPDDAWFLADDGAPRLSDPPARTAVVRSWDGHTAVVEHDGSCVLILRRVFYPGWVYRIDDGPEHPVLKVDGGLQGIPLTGSGISRVQTVYRPTGLRRASIVSLAAMAAAVLVLGGTGIMTLRARAGIRGPGQPDG